MLEPLTPGGSTEKLEVTKEVIKQGGLGVITAAIFLAGEMAGSGVLALPAAMLGTSNSSCLIIFPTFYNVRLVWSHTDHALHCECWVQWYKTRPVLDHAGGEV